MPKRGNRFLTRSKVGVIQATKAAGSRQALADLADVHRSSTYRWGRYVPLVYLNRIRAKVPGFCK